MNDFFRTRRKMCGSARYRTHGQERGGEPAVRHAGQLATETQPKELRIGNLKHHLQRWHSKEAEEMEEKETAQANKKRGKFSQ
jgi:hypothetical protein